MNDIYVFFNIFKYIGEALIGTLEDSLKNEFTGKVKKSWLKLFGIIVFNMKIGMRQAQEESMKNTEATQNDIEGNNRDQNSNSINTQIQK